MNKLTLIQLTFLISLSLSSCQPDREQIGNCFNQFKSAVLSHDGNAAINVIDKKTIDYYSTLLEKAKSLDSMQLENETFSVKSTILKIRHIISKQEILNLDGKSLLIHSINHGISNNGNIKNYSPGEIVITGDSARAENISNNKRTPFIWLFYKEEGTWKIHMHIPTSFNDISFRKLFPDSKLTENEYIFKLLETISGEKPSQKIWRPMRLEDL